MTTPTYTHITASGLLARIVCTDFAGKKPVLAVIKNGEGEESVLAYNSDLTSPLALGYNLTPLPPYHDFKIDEPVMVRDGDDYVWFHRYFAGVKDGRPTAWDKGATRWSSEARVRNVWHQCRRPTPEELESV